MKPKEYNNNLTNQEKDSKMKTADFKIDVTNKIIEQMKTCGTNWARSWVGNATGLPKNTVSQNHYNGINILLLMMEEQPSQEWATYKQWTEQGEQVKKGEKGTHIIFYKTLKIEDKKTGEENKIPMMKTYCVFNRAQLENYQAPTGDQEKFNHADAEKFIYNTGANIFWEGDKAYYRPSNDQIVMPNKEDFIKTDDATAEQNYYGTLFHELTHWTGNTNRLDRLIKRSTKKEYAFEELVAEIGATFLNIKFNIEPTPREDHAKYLNNWLEVLEEDKGAIFRASAKSGKALEFLEDLQTEEQKRKVA
jgi:antirestriction protein ArdC